MEGEDEVCFAFQHPPPLNNSCYALVWRLYKSLLKACFSSSFRSLEHGEDFLGIPATSRPSQPILGSK